MNRRWCFLGLGSLLLTIGGFWSCSAQQATSHQPMAPNALQPGPLDVKEADAPESKDAPRALKLDEFAPILAEPTLKEVRNALDEERYGDAVKAYQAALSGELSDRAPSAEYQFQLGRLLDLAERYAAAARAYEKSAAEPWLLEPYARYSLARALLRSGRPEESLRLLEQLPESLPFAAEQEVLQAEAAFAAGREQRAFELLRQHLAREPLPNGWPRAALLLAQRLANAKPEAGLEQRIEALHVARRVAITLAGTDLADRARELEQQLLGSLPQEVFQEHQALKPSEQLAMLQSLVRTRHFSDALVLADELLSNLRRRRQRFSSLDCEGRYLRNKALFGKREYTRAVDGFADVLNFCDDEELLPKALYLAGKYAAIAKRHAQAIRHFEKLEKTAPNHRLADDARLLGARSYLELGDAAQFTRLLSRMAEDYPEGDMVLDGVFELALRRIERNDWGGAANVLERGLQLARAADASRDHEWAGRERYFLARAWILTGERERGLAEFESLIRERPLAYYMQHAYSRLLRDDEGRAQAAREAAIEETLASPFRFGARPEFETDAFQRAVMLMRHGEVEWAERELATLGRAEERAPELLWAMALMYDRAGSPALSHSLARSRLTDWLGRWPVGDWEKAWRLAFPRPYRQHVQKAAKRFELPEALIYAVMREESGFDAAVVSPANAYGLMQVIRPTAKHYGQKIGLPYTEAALKKPRVNIPLGAYVLKDFQGYFPQNPLLGIPGYNAGPGRPKRWKRERPDVDFDIWVELIPFRETRRYTKRVLASRGAYAFLYESRDSQNMLMPHKLR